VFEERLDGHCVSKPDGVMKCRDAVLVGGVDVCPGREECDDAPPLVCGVWILLGADAGQFVNLAHGSMFTEAIED
jgi:hypothetical protein